MLLKIVFHARSDPNCAILPGETGAWKVNEAREEEDATDIEAGGTELSGRGSLEGSDLDLNIGGPGETA